MLKSLFFIILISLGIHSSSVDGLAQFTKTDSATIIGDSTQNASRFIPQKPKLGVFEPSPVLHKGRTIGLTSFAVSSYTITMIGMNELWYKKYDRSSFHFFNDNGEWNQIDKVGHAWTAYTEGLYGMYLYRWAGLPEKKAIWIGGLTGFFFQMGIEVLDGFSAKWGASTGDILANALGSGMIVGQQLAWGEQRILFKLSSRHIDYSVYPQLVQERAKDLFGTSIQELLLKDYNGQSYWLSVNPTLFMQTENSFSRVWPKWLCVSAGYSVEAIFGGFENKWTIENELGEEEEVDFTTIERQRQFFSFFRY